VITRLGRWWFGPVPARRLALCRLAVFGYAAMWLLARGSYVWHVAGLPARRFEPVGVLWWLSSTPPRTAAMAVWAVAIAGCTLAAAGVRLRATATLGSASLLLIATLTSSFGQVFHTEHLVVLHALILAVAALLGGERRGETCSGWPLNLMMAAVAVTYVVAGIAKLRFGGEDWLSGEVLRNWVAADNLRKVLLDDPASVVGGWLAGVPWVWPPIAVFTLLVEVGAPIALLSGRLRRAWLAGAWAFHVGIFAMMAIAFPYQLTGAAYAAFLPLERIEARVRQAGKPGTPSRIWSSAARSSSAQSEAAAPMSEMPTGSRVVSPRPAGIDTTGKPVQSQKWVNEMRA
jgi:hypothetical protein